MVVVLLDSCERLGSSRIKVRRGYHPQEVTKIDNPGFQRSALEYANYYYYYFRKKRMVEENTYAFQTTLDILLEVGRNHFHKQGRVEHLQPIDGRYR